jgi:hypothetical protein
LPVIGAEDFSKPVPAAVRECFAGPEQQAPVGPDRVGGAAAPALEFLGQALADFGEHVVAEEREVEGVHRDRGGSRIRRALRNAADGSIATTCTPRRQWRGRLKSHSPIPLWSRPSTTPRTWPVSGSTMVDIHGSKRFHPGFRVLEEPDGTEPVLIDARHPRPQPVHVRKPGRRGVQGALDQPPRDAVHERGFRGGPAGLNDGGDERVLELAR